MFKQSNYGITFQTKHLIIENFLLVALYTKRKLYNFIENFIRHANLNYTFVPIKQTYEKNYFIGIVNWISIYRTSKTSQKTH
jgi:hypothetical protein